MLHFCAAHPISSRRRPLGRRCSGYREAPGSSPAAWPHVPSTYQGMTAGGGGDGRALSSVQLWLPERPVTLTPPGVRVTW